MGKKRNTVSDFLKLRFNMEKSMVLYKKLSYGFTTERNDGTTWIPKTMEIWFAAGKKYGAIPKTFKLCFTMEKTTMVLYTIIMEN